MNYLETVEWLKSNASVSNKDFSKKIVNTQTPIIGCTTPTLRTLCKKLNDNLEEVMTFPNNEYYEIDVIKGMCIMTAKIPIEKKILHLKTITSSFNNWAVCDMTACKLKIKPNDKEVLWNYVVELHNSKLCFEKRFSVIMSLANFLDDEYIDRIFDCLEEMEYGEYYFDMGVAWFLATAFIKYKDKTINFVLNSKSINVFTRNKAMQKVTESYRVCDEDKILARSIKIK